MIDLQCTFMRAGDAYYDSFFQFIPTYTGLTTKSPIDTHAMSALQLDNEHNTIYNYLQKYYGLSFIDIHNIQLLSNDGSNCEAVFGFNPTIDAGKYPYISQLSIYDQPDTQYLIISLEKLDGGVAITKKIYHIGNAGVLQFYNVCILGVMPLIINNKSILDFTEEDISMLTIVNDNIDINVNSCKVELTVTMRPFSFYTGVIGQDANFILQDKIQSEVDDETTHSIMKQTYIDIPSVKINGGDIFKVQPVSLEIIGSCTDKIVVPVLQMKGICSSVVGSVTVEYD